MIVARLALLSVLALPSAQAKTLRIAVYDDDGRLLDTKGLLRFIGPVAPWDPAQKPALSGLYLTDLDGNPLPGRPWLVTSSSMPALSWGGAEKVRGSLPWPIAKDGFSTVFFDGGGNGYADGQTIFLNQEIADTAYRMMQDSLKERLALKEPYQPSRRTLDMVERAKSALASATATADEGRRARLFGKALQAVSFAWQQILFEHGKQVAGSPKGSAMRWGLSLDESLVDRPSEFEWIADKIARSGANWVRLTFRTNPADFTYASPASCTLYDSFLEQLAKRKIRVMGSVLDNLLWPRNVTPEVYAERTRNLVLHFKNGIRSWEVASEPNGGWIGGTRHPLPDETVLKAIQAGASEVKRLAPDLETVATLHWWEGTAGDDRHPLFAWLKWSMPQGFGKDMDVIALSVYPNRHPLGLAFDPVFAELHRLFPSQRLMLGGFSFLDEKKFSGYWWLEPENVDDARKDLMILFTGAAGAIPDGVGGGFWWPTLSQMLPPRKKTTSLYRVYKQSLQRLER